ncbi:hypothetical protein P170DRAFT_433203 [Aspergillus steynii IBT 23096]|uniref:CST complex subunit Stn1 N-terminal domain-containing protein n=1 Tax=Aspergillus steynii IBT 23096 TaxID=1392250 RepID=A0A2I2GS56_9EURO|nr:uncharacterized protein P170DRAFT_433203 [Aspergillus steynii IBT 23096]PLB55693.1 hypothetical protein P170DRAFT_433203 [Aspergillus steynii IBT 23096]
MAPAEHDELDFYPAFCFKASPTHFAWVKMMATDVHRLKRRSEFGDQSVFFYQNHPIRFVSVAGIIIARTEYQRLTILTLDDSSGATVDIVVHKAETPAPDSSVSAPGQPPPSARPNGSSIQSQWATTHVAATDRVSAVNIASLVPGSVAQIKGTLSTYRSRVQLQLERMFLVRDTSAEMRFLDQCCRFLVEVLAVPWRLTGEEIAQLRAEADDEEGKIEEEQARMKKRQRKRLEREEKDQRRIQKLWEHEERNREKEASVCKDAGVKVMREIQMRRKS